MRRTAGIVALVALSTAVAAPAHAGGRPGASLLQEITATVETPALFDDKAGGDADADDPAIWVNRADKSRSRVIGTAKNGSAGSSRSHSSTVWRVSEYGSSSAPPAVRSHS